MIPEIEEGIENIQKRFGGNTEAFREAVRLGLEIARVHVEGQKRVWDLTPVPNSVVTDRIVANLEALKL